jgi:hypothetical protein
VLPCPRVTETGFVRESEPVGESEEESGWEEVCRGAIFCASVAVRWPVSLL